MDGLGDGWESTIWDTHGTLIARVDAPDLRVQSQAFHTRHTLVVFDDLTIPYQFEKQPESSKAGLFFHARTPASATSKLEVF